MNSFVYYLRLYSDMHMEYVLYRMHAHITISANSANSIMQIMNAATHLASDLQDDEQVPNLLGGSVVDRAVLPQKP